MHTVQYLVETYGAQANAAPRPAAPAEAGSPGFGEALQAQAAGAAPSTIDPPAPEITPQHGAATAFAPDRAKLTQVDARNGLQQGTPQATAAGLTALWDRYKDAIGNPATRAQALEAYRAALDDQPMRADQLGGGGEYAPINLNRGIAT